MKLLLLITLPWICIGQLSIEDCGKTYGCFLIPNKCKTNQNDCQLMIKFKLNSTQQTIDTIIYGRSKGWIAFGLQESTNRMDGVNGEVCMMGTKSIPILKGFITEKTEFDEKPLSRKSSVLATSATNGSILCRYARPVGAENYLKDATKKHHLIVSWGPIKIKSDGEVKVEEHEVGDYYWSPDQHNLITNTIILVETFEWKSIIAHGIFMTLSWLLCAQSGMFMVRYSKNLLPNKKILGVPVWFQSHRILMMLCVVFSIAGFIAIYMKDRHIMEPLILHQSLGVIVCILVISNMLAGIFRPNLMSKGRVLFERIHRLCGLIAFVLAVICMITGFAWLHITPSPIIASVAITIIVVVTLEIGKCCVNKSSSKDITFSTVIENPVVFSQNETMNGITNETMNGITNETYTTESDTIPSTPRNVELNRSDEESDFKNGNEDDKKENTKIIFWRHVSILMILSINFVACIVAIAFLVIASEDLLEYV